MRVALTGASGYTGGRLLETLRGRGDDVSALVRAGSLSERLRSSGARLVEGDLGSREALRETVLARAPAGTEALNLCAVERGLMEADAVKQGV